MSSKFENVLERDREGFSTSELQVEKLVPMVTSTMAVVEGDDKVIWMWEKM